MIESADVFIECLRPGTMERLGLGPEQLQQINRRLIYGRYSGYGQTGPYATKSGHDCNFVALSGILSFLQDRKGTPQYPAYLLTISCGSLLFAFGILAAIIARERTGLGQVLDHSTSDAMAYNAWYLSRSQDYNFIFHSDRRAPYSSGIYKTKDGRYMSLGVYEEKYFARLFATLGIDADEREKGNDAMALRIEEVFLTKTRSEWIEIFKDVDACVVPVLSFEEAAENEHNKARNTFSRRGKDIIPNPTPRLSETPADSSQLRPKLSARKQLESIMREIDVGTEEMEELIENGAILLN